MTHATQQSGQTQGETSKIYAREPKAQSCLTFLSVSDRLLPDAAATPSSLVTGRLLFEEDDDAVEVSKEVERHQAMTDLCVR